jgi:ABC-type cobalamin/Fe3+-siderophores transport system ATPase subunit
MSDGRVCGAGMPDGVLKSEILGEVYGVDVYVGENDITGKKIIIPLSRL